VLALDCPSDPAEAEAVALAVRPELLALASRREAAEQAIRQARAERNPTVAAVGHVAVQTPTAVTESHSEFIGIEFAWPVLNHPASRGNERVARSTVREVDELRADLENVIRLQVGDSARRLADAEEALAGAEEALRAAQDAEGQAQAAREQGAATAEQLAAAQAALDQAQARRTQAECARSAAWLSRGRALGLLRTLFLLAPEEVTP
jgi:outer membrane protein TolC